MAVCVHVIPVCTIVYVYFLPCAHAQGVKQSVCLSVVVMKITRSRVLGIYVCCNYNESVDVGENWFLCTSNCRTWLTRATNHAFSVQHACGLPTAPTPCA